jgi:hypothetical protein
MTRGTRLIVTRTIDTGEGYDVQPLREGHVEGHHIDDPSRVWVQWTTGDGAGSRQLVRVDQAERWVWR